MTRRLSEWVMSAVAVATLGTVVLAQAPVTASGAWVREPVAGRPMTAAYVVIENPGAEEIQIVSASSDASAKVELHEMIREGDMMKMSPVKSIIVPAHGKVELKPGGLHIMMFDLKTALKEGDTVSLTFTTNRGWTIKVPAAVKKGGM